MDIHALQSLEFDHLRKLLIDRAVSDPGKKRASMMGPSSDITDVLSRLDAVSEITSLRLRETGWPQFIFSDATDSLAEARIEGTVLEVEQILDIADLLSLSTSTAQFFKSEEQKLSWPILSEIAVGLLVEREMVKRIKRSFNSNGDVLDEASSALRSIRVKIRRYQNNVSERLERKSRDFRQSGEDSFVTQRNGRQVISVSASEKHRLPGIVHDRSATGKTVYLEPLDIVDLNNDLAEIEREERVEIFRILSEMTAWIRLMVPQLSSTQAALAALDELNARARLAEDLDAIKPDLDPDAATLRIVKGRHPLLHLSLGANVIPLNLMLEKSGRNLIISGPNMGGKTVVLKTTGLLVLMTLSGLFIPASAGTVIPLIDEIYVDIGDEQSLEYNLSTFAGHLRNMQAIISGASERSLILIDELGAGTDPDEGSSLGIALLDEVGKRGSFSITSTHLGAFKAYAADTNGFANAAMDHNPENFQPTYRLNVGLPGMSHAFELARREGWPEFLLERASDLLCGDRIRSEELLIQIQDQRTALENEIAQQGSTRRSLLEAEERVTSKTRELQEKIDALTTATAIEEDKRLRELKNMITSMKDKLALIEKIKSAPVSPEAAAAVSDLRRQTHQQERDAAALRKTKRKIPDSPERISRQQLKPAQIIPGQRAFSQSLNMDVTLGEPEGGGRRIWIHHRALKVLVPPADLLTTESAVQKGTKPHAFKIQTSGTESTREQIADAVSMEIDLRGLDLDNCLTQLDLYVDRVLLAGLGRIRIIHGKGTGVLRKGVHRWLKVHSRIDSWREGEPGEGGWGVTIAFLNNAAGKNAARATQE